MTCKTCLKKPVWKFTNQIQLCKSCFTNYFERKIFRTIRKHNLLPKNIILKKSNDLNTKVLKSVLQKKFQVKTGKPTLKSENLSDFAEEIFQNIIKGKFKFKIQKSPLMDLSDKEIQLYAKIKKIKGNIKKRNPRIQKLFRKFMKKNPDLEHNIVNAYYQLN